MNRRHLIALLGAAIGAVGVGQSKSCFQRIADCRPATAYRGEHHTDGGTDGGKCKVAFSTLLQ